MFPTSQEKTDMELDWRKELIQPPRKPRPGWHYVKELLSKSRSAKVFLREGASHMDIVLRFPGSTQQLPSEVQKAYSQLGMNMAAVFSELLWKKPRKGSSTLWSVLVQAGYKSVS